MQGQFRNWAEIQYGPERIQLIDLAEKIRGKSEFVIGGSIGNFSNGMFEVIKSDEEIIAVLVPQFHKTSNADSKFDEGTFVEDIPGYGGLVWEERRLDEIPVMIGRMAGAGT